MAMTPGEVGATWAPLVTMTPGVEATWAPLVTMTPGVEATWAPLVTMTPGEEGTTVGTTDDGMGKLPVVMIDDDDDGNDSVLTGVFTKMKKILIRNNVTNLMLIDYYMK